MHSHALVALAHPVFDPEKQVIRDHWWQPERDVLACLTVNIGME